MSPPLREESDRLGLVEGLCDGTLDAIASDHAPHEFDKKNIEFAEAAFGILGLQTSLPLLLEFVHDGRLSRTRAVEVLSTLPAKIFNLPGGRLSSGAPADVTLLNPDELWTFEESSIASLSNNSPFIGRPLRGRALEVLIGGKRVVSNGALVEVSGS
jgi:dihydroorotase